MFNKNKKLIENAHLIPDSDIEFIPIPRPCTVKGRKAFFHKWADKKEIVIKDNKFCEYVELTEYAIEENLKRVREGYISPELDVYTRKETVGIIEYEDGTVDEVSPKDIKFTEPFYNGILHIKN